MPISKGVVRMNAPRVVCWFSCGAASAVATKLALQKYGPDRVVVAYTDTGSEHPDSERFLRDCEAWLGIKIERLKNPRYVNTWQVWEERRFLVGPKGAPCTGELKRVLRFGFQRPTDIQVFGYTDEERARAAQFRQQNFEVILETPLIDANLRKADCLAMIERAGIELPAMYRLGYLNNNCIGCVKGGMGYWNKIRRDFPDVFNRMAALERDIGASVNKERDGTPIFLDELASDRGRYEVEPDIECSLLCYAAENEVAA